MNDYRVRLETKDGHLVQNRKTDETFWLDLRGRPVHDFAKYCLEADCREKGVRLISYTVDKNGVYGIVEWLK